MVNFDESCHYKERNKADNAWNKLTGWTVGLSGKNSIRVAWRPHQQVNKVWLGAYLKEDGSRTTRGEVMDLGTYDYNQNLAISILHGEKVIITVYQDVSQQADKMFYFTKSRKPGWVQGLYFGGKNTAPHKMKITIDKQ